MLKVIKVLVEGDVPDCCYDCPFSYESMFNFQCTVCGFGEGEEIDPEAVELGIRPNWCPLTTEAEYLEGLAEEFERDSNYVEPRPEIAQFGESEE